jgi:hypothetical protein
MAGMEAELGWFAQLGRMAHKIAGRVTKRAQDWDTPESSRTQAPWRSFELADVMEEGLAREVTTSYIAPRPNDDQETRLVVERSDDRMMYLLKSERDEPVLFAKVSKSNSDSVDMYIPTGGDPPTAVGPAFTLSRTEAHGGAKDAWVLTSNRCECCEYLSPNKGVHCCKACKRDLMYIRQSPQELRGCQVMHIEVDMPQLRQDGTPAVWCHRLRANGLPGSAIAAPAPGAAAAAAGEAGGIRVVSRKPRWSARLKSLVQDFYGRCACASAKNLQMEVEGSQLTSRNSQKTQPKPHLLHGKLGANTFVLDYKHPFGMAQAFAVALTTKDWK